MNSRTYRPVTETSKVSGQFILGCFINAGSWHHAINRIYRWSAARESRYVCACNVHSLVTSRQDALFRNALLNADMVTPDGMPVTWMLRKMGFPEQPRVNGPDLMWHYCQVAETMHESVFLYGSTQQTLDDLQCKLLIAFPKLVIAGACSPPYRPLSVEEDAEITNLINSSRANMVFVSLGCPKQELWMAAHRGKINAVMMGVGAAFDYHAGTIKRAPLWMQQHGLEWLHRLCSEPRRLWKRYVVTNSIFIIIASWQLFLYKIKV